MQKVYATVIYSRNTLQIYNITAHHKDNIINLVSNKKENTPEAEPHKYNTFNDLHTAVLYILNNNNFYTGKEKMFDAVFYDIGFLNIDASGFSFSKMPYHEN